MPKKNNVSAFDDIVLSAKQDAEEASKGQDEIDAIDVDELKVEAPTPKKIGRPKGLIKRAKDDSVITLHLPLADKEWVKKTAYKQHKTMIDFLLDLIRKEKARIERLER